MAWRLLSGVRVFPGFSLMAFLFLVHGAGAEEIWQRQVVGDVEVVLTVRHAKELPGVLAESQGDHHLVVLLLERGTSKFIEGAQVKANVAEAGYAGIEKPLQPTRVDGKPAYDNLFMMPGRFEYRIAIQVRKQGVPRTAEARFIYRHHHRIGWEREGY